MGNINSHTHRAFGSQLERESEGREFLKFVSLPEWRVKSQPALWRRQLWLRLTWKEVGWGPGTRQVNQKFPSKRVDIYLFMFSSFWWWYSRVLTLDSVKKERGIWGYFTWTKCSQMEVGPKAESLAAISLPHGEMSPQMLRLSGVGLCFHSMPLRQLALLTQ